MNSIWSKIILLMLNIIILPFMMLLTTSLFYSWLIMELNTLIFIFLIILNNDKNKNLTNYFLIQAFTSLLLIIMFSINMKQINFQMMKLINLLLNLILLMKMGLMPFHKWFINMMKYSSWMNCFILMTSQKMPIYILWEQLMNLKLINFIIMLTSLNSLLNMYFLIDFKPILGFSSMIHSSWMLFNMTINMKLMLFYYIVYSIISMNFIKWLNNYKIFNYINLFNLSTKNFILFSLLNLSLSGLPPFSGFLMKWLSINNLIILNFLPLLILIFSSILSMYFYMMMSITGFINFFFKKKKIILIKLSMKNFIWMKFSLNMSMYLMPLFLMILMIN